MNGRLYDPLLRRFLNADENIQDPNNTQNYNKYGYVMNNPMMYTDPTGEFFWFVVAAAAIIGAYTTGVKANGSWNPLKWNWKATGLKILGGALVGAVSGATGAWAGQVAAVFAASSLGISGGILGGAIAGFAGGAVGGAVGGFGNAALFGENVGKGMIMGMISGAVMGGVIGGVSGGIQQGLANAKVTNTGIGTKGNMWTGKSIADGRGAWALKNTPKTLATNKINTSIDKGSIVWEDFKPTDLYDKPVTNLERELQMDGSGNWKWPPNNGAVPGTETTATLKPGYLFDRFGQPTGTYGSPLGTTYGERALMPGTFSKNYYVFEVIKELNVEKSLVMPWFGQAGGGVQFRFNAPLQKLLDDKIIRQVFP